MEYDSLCFFKKIIRYFNILIFFFLETTGLSELHPVEMLQDQAQCILGDYVRNRYARQPTRFGRLLLAIPLLRMIRASTVETVSYFSHKQNLKFVSSTCLFLKSNFYKIF